MAPPSFGHGFLVLSESADFLYKTTDYYAPEHERVIAWNDPDLAIAWPLKGAPTLSARDAADAQFRAADVFPKSPRPTHPPTEAARGRQAACDSGLAGSFC